MQLKCSVTYYLCHLLFGNNLLTSLWLQHQALSFGLCGASCRAPVRLPPLLPLLRAAAAHSWPPLLQLLSPVTQRHSLLQPPAACKGLPPLMCRADSLQPSHLMEQLSVKLFNRGSSKDTTSASQLTFMKCIVSVNSLVPAKHRQQLSVGKRRKGGAKEPLFLWAGVNTLMLYK